MAHENEIQEISKKINMSEEKVEKILKETLDAISKPSLTNTHCSFDDELGVGPSDKD